MAAPSAKDMSYILLAFKRNCEINQIRYAVVRDADGQKRVVLTTSRRDMKNIIGCLYVVLEQKPELEETLIQELERRAANLAGR